MLCPPIYCSIIGNVNLTVPAVCKGIDRKIDCSHHEGAGAEQFCFFIFLFYSIALCLQSGLKGLDCQQRRKKELMCIECVFKIFIGESLFTAEFMGNN